MKKAHANGPVDPERPCANRRHEAFSAELLTGISQAEAYRRVYPKSRKWKSSVVWVRACELARKVSGRVEFLRKQSESKLVMDRREYLERLSRNARDADQGIKPYMKADGDVEVTAANVTAALESFEAHILPGAGVIAKKIKVRDSLPYLNELAKAQGWHEPEDINVNLRTVLVCPWKPAPQPSPSVKSG